VFYDAEQDPLCYAGTAVLRNRLGLRRQDDLTDFEFAMFLSRAAEPLPAGDFDFAHYRAMHHHLFQDVYEWAGEIRTLRTGKGGNWFCYPEHIEAEANRLFLWLAERKSLVGRSDEVFPAEAAYLLSELNAIHAFREGNGRTQLVFLKALILHAGRPFDDDAIAPARTLDAMVQSFGGNLAPLTALIADIVA